MPHITLNGTHQDCETNITILEAARRVGVAIPTLCHDERLSPAGTCRLCSVEIDGEDHRPIACREQVRDGMRIITDGPEIHAFRRQILSWMAARVSPKSFADEPDKELHRLMRAFGLTPTLKRRSLARDLSHPLIAVDMSQCIDCFRCVQICENLQGQSVWHVLDRGSDIHVVPDSGTTLAASSCVGCGACVDTCPTGALTDREGGPGSGIEAWTRTTCLYCGVGCELEVGTAKGRVARARPLVDAPVSKGHLCVKGRYAFGFNHAPGRQKHPLLREGGHFIETSWDGALARCAEEFRRILALHGPDSIGILGSARTTNEESYLTQKFARIVLGTNNVDCCARVCHTPSAAALKPMLGTGAATNSFDDIECAQTLFVVGANPLENHPVVGARMRQHVRRGAKLIVIDPRNTEIARIATVHLAPKPGTNIPLLNAMAHVIIAEKLADQAFIESRVAEWDLYKAHIAQWTPQRAAKICGVSQNDIVGSARLYATAKPAMAFHGLGLTEHVQGTEGVMALVDLALVTGNIGRPGSGINPLRGQNNVQGAAHMGCDPSTLPGSVAIEDRRPLFEQIWGATLPRNRGLNAVRMMDAALAGRLKALWVIGYDILPTLANLAQTQRALRNLEFVVVQDLFLTRTGEFIGDVFLPAASVLEKDGTFMNSERRIQRVRKALSPPGNARADWEIIADLAQRMGHGAQFHYGSAQDIWEEIRQVWPEGAGISYARIDHGGLQWPCRNEDDPGTTILHAGTFAHGKAAKLQRIDFVPTTEQCSEAFPFLLTTGRNLYQFNAGTMTMRTSVAKLRRTDTLDMAAPDAKRLGIADGGLVRVESRHGMVRIKVRVADTMREGELFATFHDPRVGLNRLTGPQRDRIVDTPEYKVTAVRVIPD